MRVRKNGWKWTAWMTAAILMLGAVKEREQAPFVSSGHLTAEAVQNGETSINKRAEGRREEAVSLHAQSAVLMDGKTGRVLYGKGEELQRPMASTTKIMTCILALELGEPEENVEVSGSASAQPQVRMGMKKGERYYLKDLLYALMLESYNDAAVAIAEHIGGTIEGFADKMNEKARILGCENTHFITPNGLDAQEQGADGQMKIHSTTARDLARIMAYCVLESPKKEEFLTITRTRNYSFTDIEKKRSISCVNHNALLDMDKNLLSGKTGFTGGAGYSYVAAEEEGGRVFTIALLGCGWPPDKTWKWADAKKLMEYGKEHYHYKDVYQKVPLSDIPVENGLPESGDLAEPAMARLVSEGEEGFPVLLGEGEQVEITVNLVKNLTAPVKAGTKAGEICYLLDGRIIRKDPVTVLKEVKKIGLPWCFGRILGEYVL